MAYACASGVGAANAAVGRRPSGRRTSAAGTPGLVVRASASSGEESGAAAASTSSRRQVLTAAAALGLALAPGAVPLPGALPGASPLSPLDEFVMSQLSAEAATDVKVGTYLPSAGVDNLVVFTPGPRDTPALRAGNVSPYSFFLPPTWVQQRIANILSGNYCQPKCAEPWIEVKFEDPKQGTLQVVASPMVRLTNQPQAKIEEIGPPEKIIAALGPFVTGDSYEPEEVVEISTKQVDGQTYYKYALETPYARSGAHNLAAATAKGDTVLLMVISASESQWSANEPLLRKLLDSFRVV